MIVLIIITFCYNRKLSLESKIIHELTLPESKPIKVTTYMTLLYYPSKKGKGFETEEIALTENLKTTESILKDILDSLIFKLEEKKIIPKVAYNYEIYLNNRTLYLDLDSKIFSATKTARDELLIIYSFVNSLLAPGGSDEVVILIDGKNKTSLNFINLSKSYKINTNI